MKSNFLLNKYDVVKQAVSKEKSDFLYKYFFNKRKVVKHLLETDFITVDNREWGTWEDPQMLGTYSHYSDLVFETLLETMLPKMMEVTELSLVPTYSYARMYKKGDELIRHIDRASCEVSCTVFLGGEEWPIYLDPTGEFGRKGNKVNLKAGDMLVYRGCDLEHWREPFKGQNCAQVFLHYNSVDDKSEAHYKYDTRPFLGLPEQYKNPKKIPSLTLNILDSVYKY